MEGEPARHFDSGSDDPGGVLVFRGHEDKSFVWQIMKKRELGKAMVTAKRWHRR